MDVSLADDLEKRKRVLKDLNVAVLPAIWLRPEAHPSAGATASKIGGQIAWPTGVRWPICDGGDVLFDEPLHQQNDHYIALAQFRPDEFPEISFPEGSDILQLLWCPRFHEHPQFEYGIDAPKVGAFWHSVGTLEEIPNPIPKYPNPYLIPLECVFRALRLDDAPIWHHLTDAQKLGITERLPPPVRYSETFGPIPGTKLLGYADSHGNERPECNCGRRMTHLFTISSYEVGPGSGEWYWRYDPDFRQLTVHRSICPVGLDALDGRVHIFYCEICPERPIRVLMISG